MSVTIHLICLVFLSITATKEILKSTILDCKRRFFPDALSREVQSNLGGLVFNLPFLGKSGPPRGKKKQVVGSTAKQTSKELTFSEVLTRGAVKRHPLC